MNYPKITDVVRCVKETEDVKTLYFNFQGEIVPGQFFMVWIPGVDEIPMSVSHIKNDDVKGVTFKRVGEATNALYGLKKGDVIGVRGPYGNGFKIKHGKILFVAGGTGLAALTPALEEAAERGVDSIIVFGVKNKKELFFEDRMKKTGARILICTEDGSKGHKCLATTKAKELIKKESFSQVITCGPEAMMKKLLDVCENIDFQASVERYMRCAVGLCGQCCIGDGLRVCRDGPVFNGETLRKTVEFGVFKRDASGRKTSL